MGHPSSSIGHDWVQWGRPNSPCPGEADSAEISRDNPGRPGHGDGLSSSKKKFVFQHDHAPPNDAPSTNEFLASQGVPVLDWTANSPDMKPIERLWGYFVRRLGKRPWPESEEQYWDVRYMSALCSSLSRVVCVLFWQPTEGLLDTDLLDFLITHALRIRP